MTRLQHGWMRLALGLTVATAMGGAARAATTDSIVVTVSLIEEVSVSVTPGTWNIGPVGLGAVSGPETFTASIGNVATDLTINASNAAGGWTVGSPAAADVFQVAVDDPVITLTPTDQDLASDVAPYGSVAFDLTYSAPTSDSFGAGVDQSFSILLKASAAP